MVGLLRRRHWLSCRHRALPLQRPGQHPRPSRRLQPRAHPAHDHPGSEMTLETKTRSLTAIASAAISRLADDISSRRRCPTHVLIIVMRVLLSQRNQSVVPKRSNLMQAVVPVSLFLVELVGLVLKCRSPGGKVRGQVHLRGAGPGKVRVQAGHVVPFVRCSLLNSALYRFVPFVLFDQGRGEMVSRASTSLPRRVPDPHRPSGPPSDARLRRVGLGTSHERRRQTRPLGLTSTEPPDRTTTRPRPIPLSPSIPLVHNRFVRTACRTAASLVCDTERTVNSAWTGEQSTMRCCPSRGERLRLALWRGKVGWAHRLTKLGITV